MLLIWYVLAQFQYFTYEWNTINYYYYYYNNEIRCPAGLKMSNSQCVNENECLWFPCQNGGRCKDLTPPRKYECQCPLSFTGMHCELELSASGVLKASFDFIITLVICAGCLISKYFVGSLSDVFTINYLNI